MPKAAKDDNKPKKALSAYMFFSIENRKKITEEMPDLKFAEIAKEISSRWKGLEDSQRKKYDKKAEEDKKRYETEMKSYAPPVPEKKKRATRTKK